MPLLDHFHPPRSERRHWEAFHARWASAIADDLNDNVLPERPLAIDFEASYQETCRRLRLVA
jgi:hypothetical protein